MFGSGDRGDKSSSEGSELLEESKTSAEWTLSAGEDWDSPVFQQACENGLVVVEYPRFGWKKWWPIILEKLRLLFIGAAVVILWEGMIVGSLESWLDSEESGSAPTKASKHWFWSTLDGDLPFYDANACTATMFDVVVGNLFLSFLMLPFACIGTYMGNYTVTAIVGRDGITLKSAARSFGLKQILFKHPGVTWQQTPCWRTLFGPLYAPQTALWVGAYRMRTVEEVFQISTGKFGERVVESRRAFPEWNAVYLQSPSLKDQAEDIMLETEPVDTPGGFPFSEAENVCCMSCLRRSLPRVTESFEEFVANALARGGEPEHTWTGTAFDRWRLMLTLLAGSIVFSLFSDMCKPNAFSHHWLKGNAALSCGITLEDTTDNVISSFVLGALVTAFFMRGKCQVTAAAFSDFLLIYGGRTATLIRWSDIVAVHTVSWPGCNPNLYRPGSLVLRVNAYENVELTDSVREACACGCCCFGYLDGGLCGIFYLSAVYNHTTSTEPDAFLEVPGAAAHLTRLRSFADAFKTPTPYSSSERAKLFAV